MSDINFYEHFLLVVVITASFSFLAGLLAALVMLRRMGRNCGQDADERVIQILGELSQFGQRIGRIESMLGDSQDLKRLSAEDPVYGPAAQMIQQGIAPEEVAGRLGISTAEVDLLAVLHKEGRP